MRVATRQCKGVKSLVQIRPSSHAALRQDASDVAERALNLAGSCETIREILRDYDDVCHQLKSPTIADGLAENLRRIRVELVLELRRELSRRAHATTSKSGLDAPTDQARKPDETE